MATAGTRRIESPLLAFASRLMSATSFAAPARSPFDGYGVVAAGSVAARAKTVSKPGFGVKEARARIAEFIDGTFNPRSLSEMVDYLSDRFLQLELRVFDGRTANYVVDRMTRQSVPAASVDARLSRPALRRRFGIAVDAGVEARRREALTPEQIDARNLRARVSGAFRESTATGTPFQDWDDAAFSAPILFQNRELTIQGNEAWVGMEYARASADPEVNLRIVDQARRQGVKVVLPAETRDSVRSGRLVAGMPILLREGAVRTRFIDPSLTMDGMTKAFGVSPFEHFRATASLAASARAADVTGGSKVVQFEDFRKFRRKAVPARTAPPSRAIVSEEVASRCVVKQELDARGREVMSFLDPRTGDEYPFDPATAPVGVFRKEDAFGLPVGYVQVGEDGGYAHFDLEERRHNDYGPATVSGRGSDAPDVYAVDGQTMSSRDFRRRGELSRAPVEAPARAPSERRRSAAREDDYDRPGGARHSM